MTDAMEKPTGIYDDVNYITHPLISKQYNIIFDQRPIQFCPNVFRNNGLHSIPPFPHIDQSTLIIQYMQARRQEFTEGGSSIRQGIWGPLKALRIPGAFVAKCNLAISRHFIQTSGKPYFPLLIFKDIHQIYTNQDFDNHSLNRTST